VTRRLVLDSSCAIVAPAGPDPMMQTSHRNNVSTVAAENAPNSMNDTAEHLHCCNLIARTSSLNWQITHQPSPLTF
jgi:hypothetical protein